MTIEDAIKHGEEQLEIFGGEHREFIEMAIKALKRELRWIPVTERLPEQDGQYLLFGEVTDGEYEGFAFIGSYDSCAEKFGYWYEHYSSDTYSYIGEEFVEYYKVVAWMPLPEPYKGGE